MSSQPQYHDTSGSHCHTPFYPPEPASNPLGVIEEQLGSTRDDDTLRPASLDDAQLDPTPSSDDHEHEPQEQEQLWTVEDILTIQQQYHQALIEEVRATNAEHRLLTEELMAQNMSKCFSQGLRQMTGFLAGWMKRFRRDHLASRVAALEEELNLAVEQNRQLSEEYKEMRARHNSVSAKLDKALRERDEQRRLVDGGTLADSSKVTDDAIMGRWKTLDYNIRTLAHSLAKSPPSKPADQVVLARLIWISESYLKHLQDEEYREILLRGYLWSTVDGTVFGAGTRIWGGPGLADLKTIQDNIVSK